MFIPDVETAEAEDLRGVVRSLIQKRSPEAAVRAAMVTDLGYDPELWHQMAAELGLQGLAIAEEFGGSGAGVAELAVIYQELGRGVVPSPYFSTVALAATLLAEIGDADANQEFLPGIAAGTSVATVALAGENETWELDDIGGGATSTDTGWTLNGTRRFVTDGSTADLILVPVRTAHGVSVFAVGSDAAGLKRDKLVTLDLTRGQADVTFTNTPARLIGTEGGSDAAVARTIQHAILSLVAEQAGAAEFLMGLSLEYAKIRYQFGRPIGGFQAIKHKLAEMAFDLERLKSVLLHLVTLASDDASDPKELETVTHLAKAYASEAFFRIAADTIQTHGGIGFTWEHPAHLYFRKAKSTELLFGQPEHHRERMLHGLGV